MPVFFEYVPRNTVIHRLHSLTKVILILGIFITISVLWDPRYLAVCMIVVMVLYLLSKTPKKWLLIAVPFGAYRFIEAGILGVTQPAEVFKYLPPEMASQVLFSFGPITFYFGGFLWALAYVFRIFIGMGATFMFIYATSLNDLIKSLRNLHVPDKISYIAVVALRFVPELFREINLTSTAQSLRGWRLRTRNPVKMAKMAVPIAGPFTRRIVSYVDRITLTTQVRAFGGGKIKYREKLGLRWADWVVIILTIVIVATILYFNIFYGFGLI